MNLDLAKLYVFFLYSGKGFLVYKRPVVACCSLKTCQNK
jgi:hypothetical protein